MSRVTAVPQQDAIEIFVNNCGDVCLTQQSDQQDASLVWVAPEHVERVIKALRAAKREALEARRSEQ